MFGGPQASVLGVGVSAPPDRTEGDGLRFSRVASARQAREMLRLERFDLLLLPLELPDADVWEFVRKTRIEWPWQKWALVGPGGVSEQDQRTARMMGAVTIFFASPDVSDLVEWTTRVRSEAAASFREPGTRQDE